MIYNCAFKASVFNDIKSGARTLNISVLKEIMSPIFKFMVGDLVNVTRRKQANMNQEGGRATIVKAYLTNGEAMYDVHYLVDSSRTEEGLTEGILTRVVDAIGRSLRHSSCTSGNIVANNILFFNFVYSF